MTSEGRTKQRSGTSVPFLLWPYGLGAVRIEWGDSMTYQPKHAKHASPAELPPALRALADRIVIVDSSEKE